MKKSILTILSIVMSLSMSMVSLANQATQSARWTGEGDTWRVSDNQGGYLTNTWFQDDITGHWYLLGGGEDGSLMFSGLITDQSTGKTYFLNTNHDGTFGRMLTENGSYTLNGQSISLTFNQEHKGEYGAIVSGLEAIRGIGLPDKELPSIPTGESGSQSTGNNNVSGGGNSGGGSRFGSSEDAWEGNNKGYSEGTTGDYSWQG